MRPRIRDYAESDLGQVVDLCQREGLMPEGPDGLTLDDVAGLVNSPAQTLVAEAEGEVVGLAVGSVTGPVGSVFRIAGEPVHVERLLDELERRLVEHGARTLTIALRDDRMQTHLEDRGYEPARGVALLTREIEQEQSGLTHLGGRVIDPGLWDQLQGMEQVKDVIERRIILPLAEPELASHHGVTAPQSVVLFGPPGTGKTTFAKCIGSRLHWPFVPVEVAQLAGEDGNDPTLLAETFDDLLAAPAAVAFFDEVEDLAADRQAERRVSSRVTNEFLRQLPRMRESFDHLLVCATNSVRSLDPAFLRPGRFDYILPVGPPDAEARTSIWSGYADDITDEDVDLPALVEASEWLTPADMEFAARKAAQSAFEREYFNGSGRRADTDDFLAAIRDTRPTLTDEMVAAFEEDVEQFARY